MTAKEEKLQNFLTALDAVKQDYTCGQCSEMLKDPVTLSACFHLVCSAHFGSLTHCPTCKIPLTNCTTYKDGDIESNVNLARDLCKIFEEFQKSVPTDINLQTETSNNTSQKGGKSKSGRFTPEMVPKNKPEKSSVLINTSIKAASKSDLKIQKAGLNTTVLSSASSNINKGNEKKNKKGETALHIACRLGKVESVIELLNQGANTNTKDNAGWTPLHEVVQNGRLDLLKLLLEHNTLIDVPGPGNETPLHEAIRYNHKEIAIELVKNGANINARNCKGETPIQLASEEMKQLLKQAEQNIIQTQGINITYISELHSELDFEEITVYCVSAFRTVLNKLKMLAKHHSNLHIETKLTKKVTHLIVDTDENDVCASTVEVLQGIVNGIWILTTNWITKSTEKKLAQFKNYEVIGVGTKIYNGPRNSRYNKYKQLPGIFDGCHFYFHNFNIKFEISPTIVLTKAMLIKLVTDAGGVVLRRAPNPELIPESEQLVPYHASETSKLFKCSHYIIYKDTYEPLYNMPHLKALPIGWLIECIEKYELCEPW
ncbi:BRCA1-associated RING domain protein 1-like [Maniola jurtina]|uniref:BRCA1-associated RING domain protein 1-like n=1 Tax=Maniola jurtina TaxID=191418 RepID=UPI001E688EC0|nr:BRCA1-associated RING domain protein 1-like [Maniola jurtina]